MEVSGARDPSTATRPPRAPISVPLVGGLDASTGHFRAPGRPVRSLDETVRPRPRRGRGRGEVSWRESTFRMPAHRHADVCSLPVSVSGVYPAWPGLARPVLAWPGTARLVLDSSLTRLGLVSPRLGLVSTSHLDVSSRLRLIYYLLVIWDFEDGGRVNVNRSW